MAYDEGLAERVREALASRRRVSEKQMFGGIAFMIDGKMGVGVHGSDLIVRVAAEAHDRALKEPGVRTFDMTGRPMKGWLLVGPAGTRTGSALGMWVERSVDFATSLPAKPARKKRPSATVARRGRR